MAPIVVTEVLAKTEIDKKWGEGITKKNYISTYDYAGQYPPTIQKETYKVTSSDSEEVVWVDGKWWIRKDQLAVLEKIGDKVDAEVFKIMTSK